MILMLLGPPGCGKGTQGQKIAARYKILKLAAGDILRQAVAEKTELGIKAKEFMDKGRLLPDDLIVGVMEAKIKNCRLGFILDGFPRTIRQAEELNRILSELGQKIFLVINLEVSDKEVVMRLSGRRSCLACGAVYNLLFPNAAAQGKCDKCGGELVERSDDKEETIKERLRIYRAQTEPLIDYYSRTKLLRNVGGTGGVDDVFNDICSLIEKEGLPTQESATPRSPSQVRAKSSKEG